MLTADRLGIEVSLLLHSRPTVPVVLRLPMTLGGGLRVTQTANGDLQLLDAAGTLVAYSPAPTMYGAGIDPHSGLPTQRSAIPSTIVQAPAGPELDLTPDMGFLSDPGTVYPVTVDPSTSLSLDVDTFLQSGYPNSTDGASQTDLRVGTYDGGGNYEQSYVQFHAGPIKGKTVTAATLHLWEFHSWSCTPGEFRVYQAGKVSASSTWNSRPPAYQQWYDGSFAYGNSSSCPGRDVPINLAAAARFWAGDGYSETETLLLAAGSGSDNNQYKKFSSSRGYVPPSVSVTYNDTTPTAPDGLRTQFTDTLVPRMSGTVHDADNSAMTAYFTVRNAAGTVIGGAGGSQANVPNGAVAGFQIPGTQLIPGQGYTWSMHACANGLCSAETSAVSFRVNPLKGAGALRGHHSTSVSSSAGAKVSVDLASGNASVGVTGFTFAGNAGFSLPVGVRYDSMAVAPGAVPASGSGGAGLGWRFASGPGVSMTITPDKTLDVITPGGAVHDFCCDPGPNYFRNGNYDADFNKQPEGTYRLIEHASQSEYDFNPAGQLTDQRDRNHNSFHFTYDTGGGLTQIDAQNPAGQVVRSLTVSTDSAHRITGVAQAGDGATPGRSAHFRYNSAGYLEQVTDPAGQNTALGYDSTGNLTSLTTPGGRQVSVGYDSSHRATSLTQRDPNATDATTNLAYSTPSPTTTQTKLYDPDHPTSGGVATTYDADNTGKITRVTDPFGQHTDTTYTPSGNPGGDQVATANSPAAGMTTNTYSANGGESQTKSQSPTGTSTAAYTNTGPANKYLPSQVSDPTVSTPTSPTTRRATS